MSDVGKNIRKLRLERKLTQDELAEALFVSRQTISNYETGKSHPDVETLLQIAEQLDTDANALLYGPPVAPDQKRARQKLFVMLAVSAVLAVCCIILMPRAEMIGEKRYVMGPLLLVRGLLLPCFLLVLGRSAMQAVELLFGAKPPKLKKPVFWRWIVIVALALYLVIVAPDCFVGLLEWVRFRPGIPLQSESWTTIPPLWGNFASYTLMFVMLCPYCFLFPGIVLWITETGEKKARHGDVSLQ